MFERRLKIFLFMLLLVTAVMLMRAVQLQVFGRDNWQQQAVESMKRPRLIETTRGTIFDHKGKPIALDEACIDAAVDFRAVVEPPDPAWVKEQAVARVRRELGDAYGKTPTEQRKRRIDDAIKAVEHDLGEMWTALAAELNAKDPAAALEQIEDTRRGIVERVRMRRRYVWYHKYQDAVTKDKKGVAAPWYAKWLLDDEGEDGPDIDNFIEDVGEQEAAHPILHDISNETLIRLKKSRDRYPGLTFVDSTVRRYPYRNVAAHVLGRLSKVMSEDIKNDPNFGKDELRAYEKNDLIGRMGLEALCEPALRGTRGQVVRVVGEDKEISRIDSIPGANVTTTIDIEMQREIEELFQHVNIGKDVETKTIDQIFQMHGAAVVIDVPSGEVRALASWPNYDANRFDDDYETLRRNDRDQPLLNRATQWAIEPGSTVKPMVGMGAIADGKLGVNEGIECTGYLVLHGQTYKTSHRCWTARMFASDPKTAGLVAHHQIGGVPHRGHDGNPDGFLTYSDALERSCNVYFATVAERLKIDGLHKWFSAFGLGRPTGIGIAESRGWLPSDKGLSRRATLGDTLNAGIGQGQVGATTIQMANVAATIARGGIWVRPSLVGKDVPTTRPAALMPDGPDRVDLKIPPEAIAAARWGMYQVIHSDGGTASYDPLIRRTDVAIAGKTGSAQAPKFRIPAHVEETEIKDEMGKVIGKRKTVTQWDTFTPASEFVPDAPIKWYRGFGKDGQTLSHAWFIGFAPYDNPQVAFAVMVEYGGSGGTSAACVANGVVDACIRHGYLTATAPDAHANAGAAAGIP